MTFGVESPAYVAIRWAQSVGVSLLVGTAIVRWLILPRAKRALAQRSRESAAAGVEIPAIPDDDLMRRVERLAAPLALALFVVEVARLAAQYHAVAGGDAFEVAILRALVFSSHWGGAWIATLLGAALILAATRLRVRDARWVEAVFWSALVVTAAGVASGGHAATGGWQAEALQTLHVLAAGAWIGSLAVVVLVVIPPLARLGTATAHATVAAVIAAFSPVALVAGALLLATGVSAAARALGSFDALWLSTYGRTLIVKLALLGVTAGTGAYNWRRVLPTLGTAAGSTARLRRSSAVELVAALAILVVTAVLVATPLPAELSGAVHP